MAKPTRAKSSTKGKGKIKMLLAFALAICGITVILDVCDDWCKGAKIALCVAWCALSALITINFYNYF